MLTHRWAFVRSIWRKWIDWIIFEPSHQLKTPSDGWITRNSPELCALLLNEYVSYTQKWVHSAFCGNGVCAKHHTGSSFLFIQLNSNNCFVWSTFACVSRTTVCYIQLNRHRTIRWFFRLQWLGKFVALHTT